MACNPTISDFKYPLLSSITFLTLTGDDEIDSNSQKSINSTVSITPLPSSWMMLIAGFLGLGYFAYCGTKKATARLAAA